MADAIDNEMAAWYRNKQLEIDKALADIDAHNREVGHKYFEAYCGKCWTLRKAIERARYYGD
jgi:hypothetical protein